MSGVNRTLETGTPTLERGGGQRADQAKGYCRSVAMQLVRSHPRQTEDTSKEGLEIRIDYLFLQLW